MKQCTALQVDITVAPNQWRWNVSPVSWLGLERLLWHMKFKTVASKRRKTCFLNIRIVREKVEREALGPFWGGGPFLILKNFRPYFNLKNSDLKYKWSPKWILNFAPEMNFQEKLQPRPTNIPRRPVRQAGAGLIRGQPISGCFFFPFYHKYRLVWFELRKLPLTQVA